jgi:hypothetical protein
MARKGPPPAPWQRAEGTGIGRAGKLSAHDIAYRAALQAEIIAGLRFQKSVEKLHRLGPRVLHALLCEFAPDRMLQTEIERLIERYAGLRPERLRAVPIDLRRLRFISSGSLERASGPAD